MRRVGFMAIGFVSFLVPLVAQPFEQRQSGTTTQAADKAPVRMNNQDVINLVKAGLSEEVIIGAIGKAAANADFDLAADGLIALAKANVPTAIIRAMQAGKSVPPDAAAAESPRRVRVPRRSSRRIVGGDAPRYSSSLRRIAFNCGRLNSRPMLNIRNTMPNSAR